MWKNKRSLLSCSDFGLRPALRDFGLRISVFGFLCLCCLFAAGCKKSSPADEPRTQTTASPSAVDPQTSPVARIHWLGKKQIAAETNATGFMKIWNLPESARVEAQTLDKFSTAPWRLLKVGAIPSAVTNAQTPIGASPLLRPLLDDLVQEECYVEIRQPTNQPSEVVLAIKLDDTRARLWETNLAAVIESLGGTRSASAGSGHGWQMELTQAGFLAPKSNPAGITSRIELTRTRDWTVLSLGAPASVPASFRDLVSRIERDYAPLPPPKTNFWLKVDGFDLRPLVSALGLSRILPVEPPKLSLTFIGDGTNVFTRGQLDFAKPVPYREEKWNIPTNLISQYLVSFTSIRGIAPWLASFKPWNDLQAGPPPNQLFIWAPLGASMETYFAAPQPDATNQVSKLTDLILQKGGPFFATNPIAKFERSHNFNGLDWNGVPFIMPFLKSFNTNGNDWVFGGLFQPDISPPPPVELLQQVLGPANLLYYDWEVTGPRMDQWIYLSQFFRFAFYRAQMDIELPSQAWLKKVALKLGNCGTAITLTAPNQLSFVRRSSVGLTDIEMNLLADWLESSDFPRGFHSQEHSDLQPGPGMFDPNPAPPGSPHP